MKVEFTAPARRQVERIDTWWRANRDKAPDLFKHELSQAEEFLRTAPHLAKQYVTRGSRTIRYVVMSKTKVKLYFWVNEAAGVVRIVSAWGGKRGAEPNIR